MSVKNALVEMSIRRYSSGVTPCRFLSQHQVPIRERERRLEDDVPAAAEMQVETRCTCCNTCHGHTRIELEMVCERLEVRDYRGSRSEIEEGEGVMS